MRIASLDILSFDCVPPFAKTTEGKQTGPRIKSGVTVGKIQVCEPAKLPSGRKDLALSTLLTINKALFIWKVQISKLAKEFAGFFVVGPGGGVLINEISEIIPFGFVVNNGPELVVRFVKIDSFVP